MRSPRVLTLLALAALSCKHEPSIVGNWTGALSGSDFKAEFDPDNTMKVGVKVGSIGADFTGTYKIDPKYLTLQFKDYKLSNVPPGAESAAKSIAEGMKSKPFKGTYHFNNVDELALTYDNKTDVLKRVKEE